MGASVLIDRGGNGGFPKPPRGARLRVVEAHHESCGARTRVMVPAVLPARVVRRVQCSHCGERFEADTVAEVGAGTPLGRAVRRLRGGARLPSFDPSSRAWRIASVPIAALLVIGGLLLIQGGGDDSTPRATAPPASEGAGDAAPLAELPGERGGGGGAKNAAQIVRGSSYSLALPQGWEKVEPPAGATFAAAAASGEAEATLWIEQDPSLDFPAFITRSLRQLETLAPNPRVVSRVPGPTPETTAVRLAADAPPDQPAYEVLLRAAGPYRYYLAFTVQPDAGREAVDGVDLLANTFTPEVRD